MNLIKENNEWVGKGDVPEKDHNKVYSMLMLLNLAEWQPKNDKERETKELFIEKELEYLEETYSDNTNPYIVGILKEFDSNQ